ncbi:hypothetical protein D9615_003177 [Tricholomella constricta]|uniref:3'-5' exonuclease domain-containing protein n=1 Tax=Tricholomella constricta TaxID=117010 RepID=A0A8H5HJ81_9AGAR|nr:hypothetical protein D9615_003177 [Tricholomella constricta]
MACPLGSKDGPRPPGAPRRGRPPKKARKEHESEEELDADDEYGFDEFSADYWQEVDHVECEALGAGASVSIPEPSGSSFEAVAGTEELLQTNDNAEIQEESLRINENASNRAASTEKVMFEHLQGATKWTQTFPFFTRRSLQGLDSDNEDEDEDDGMELQNYEDFPSKESDQAGKAKRAAWFDKPKTMPNWLYKYFAEIIMPLIFTKDTKDARQLAKPPTFSETSTCRQPPSFWVHPPEPAILLSRRRFVPSTLYQPRVFLWLLHFYVNKLCCPDCASILEKNGALKPRLDIEDSFYIVTWSYYCRKGCRSHFHGWTKRFLYSLPAYLRMAFPAILLQKSGLSRNIILQLRVGNQHKMGPTGARSQLLEMHTTRFSVLQGQYLEAIFELVHGRQDLSDQVQSTLHNFMPEHFPSFGDFGDPQEYAGFVPSQFYLAQMMNKAIESDESDANQHTACLAPDQLAIDDSHKVNKHIAKIDAHEERAGPLLEIANSVKRYGFSDPPVVFSDDPVKDKQMIYMAFPSLAKNLTPVAAAYGLKPITLPNTVKVLVLDTLELTESTLASIMAPLDLDPDTHLCIAPHSEPDSIFIIPVHKFPRLPTSLLRLLISAQVFKVGSAIKGDITHLKKQFCELDGQNSFNLIDLKEYCIQRGLIVRGASASLDVLVEKTLNMYLPKDGTVRKSEEWEVKHLLPEHICYAAMDVFATRAVFERAMELAPRQQVTHESPRGTRIALSLQEGGDIIAYGMISAVQPTSLGHLQAASSSSIFQMVTPLSLLSFDCRCNDHDALNSTTQVTQTPPHTSHLPTTTGPNLALIDPVLLQNKNTLDEEAEENDEEAPLYSDSEDKDSAGLDMLEAHFRDTEKEKGKRQRYLSPEVESSHFDPIATLQKLVNTPGPTALEEFTRIKKDIFHAFQMIPTSSVNHGIRPEFLRALRDHVMRWDPATREIVDQMCRRVFDLSFEQMLLRNPRWIAERTPRHVPSPAILVPAIQHVFNTFGNAIDATSKQPLFNKAAWKKANAVLELARQGYLSDIDGIPMYEKAGLDKYRLQKWRCLQGTNNVEGGPHGDIYRKFGALHTGPRLTVNCLTDHRMWYNLQAFAKHLYGVDWDYHHSLGLINHTSFLLNYLSDVVGGAAAYSEWINGDLYERTTEKFGICPVPEALRIHLSMESYSAQAATQFSKLSSSDHWLRQRQGLALPALPPTTPEARRYFFSQVRHFAALWNQTANGKSRFYVTTDVLMAYAKSWDKTTNIRASRELITNEIVVINKTRNVFAVPNTPFPSFITITPTSTQPLQGVIVIDPDTRDEQTPASLSIDLALSHPVIPPPSPQQPPILRSHVDFQVTQEIPGPPTEPSATLAPSTGTSTPPLPVNDIAIKEVNWTLPKFLEALFTYNDLPSMKRTTGANPPTSQRRNMVQAFLNGTSKPHAGQILDLIYEYACEVTYRSNDNAVSAPTFTPDRHFAQITHAKPAITSWAVGFVTKLVHSEGGTMVHPTTGLHLRARSKQPRSLISWSAIESFSYRTLQTIAENNAPILWAIVSAYVNSTAVEMGETAPLREQRPQNLVATSAVMSLTFGRSQLASLYPLCRAIWHFAVRSHQSAYRVESRLGHSVAYQTMIEGLKTLAADQRKELRGMIANGRHGLQVSDNIQAYAPVRGARIGRESRMVKGLAATVVIMEDVVPGAFDLGELLRRQALQERRNLSPELIFDDIDWTHQDHVREVEFIRPLIHCMPALSIYREDLKVYASEKLCIFPLPKTRHTKIFPLATNGYDEMHIQEMKQAVLDFTDQMGIDAGNLNGRCIVTSGDGKTFEQLLKLRRHMVAEDGDFESFRWIIPLLELWHTKWTDLSRTVRGHWGEGHADDLSTLACLAKLAGCPTPSNLRKVEFYDGAHLIELSLDAHILNCWEFYYETADLESFLESKKAQGTLPTFEELLKAALMLGRRHATTKAFKAAHNPSENNPDKVPQGSPWTPKKNIPSTSLDTVEDDEMTDTDSDVMSDLLDEVKELTSKDADVTLANATLFMRDGIWWREMCRAVAEGDTGRVWEILKIWIFTFAGSGNPYYSQYLLELYCNFKWEFDEATSNSIMSNWLVCLHELGDYSEMDLMQEGHNRVLEEQVQHKGKEFDDPFYRDTVSMNVHHLTRLRDEMEEAVSLKLRTKNHSVTDLLNELRALLACLRDAEVNRYRPGRNEGFTAIDDFEEGWRILHQKITKFIARTIAYLDILGHHTAQADVEMESSGDDDWEDSQRSEVPDNTRRDLPRIRIINVELYVTERTGKL